MANSIRNTLNFLRFSNRTHPKPSGSSSSSSASDPPPVYQSQECIGMERIAPALPAHVRDVEAQRDAATPRRQRVAFGGVQVARHRATGPQMFRRPFLFCFVFWASLILVALTIYGLVYASASLHRHHDHGEDDDVVLRGVFLL